MALGRKAKGFSVANTEEKQKRKALLAQVKQAEQAKQEDGLPLSKSEIKALFDYVNVRLEADDCDHTLRHTLAFLSERHLPARPVVVWLQEYGGFCDCEVIANVEETWGERVGSLTA